MVRGETPIELGDSWFSAKTIEVVRPQFKDNQGALSNENGLECGKARPPEAGGLTMKKKSQSGTDRLWAIRSTV